MFGAPTCGENDVSAASIAVDRLAVAVVVRRGVQRE